MLKGMNVENFITAWCIKCKKKKIRFLSLFVFVCVSVCVCPEKGVENNSAPWRRK